ncbi:MAG: methyltransferase domain-containing protein [Actinobacteria bacterium]|nr:methyltransferase domain-containing protein [Actinomycetota bacterium]
MSPTNSPRDGSHATLERSVRLLKGFRTEQTDPDGFYGMLAEDMVTQIDAHVSVAGATALDVGTGAGYMTRAMRGAGARCYGIEYDIGELTWRGEPPTGIAIGSALEMPFVDGAFDITFSSNVLEHVPDPWTMADEMVRVTRPGGIVYLSYTNWLSPWGGHETAPWHYLGGERAARRYERKTGKRAKNRFGESLFAVSVGDALRWARANPATRILSATPRYHPSWAQWVVKVPGLREIVTWNLVLILEKR